MPSAISPIGRVPPELMREVFKACLPADDYSQVSRDGIPLILTQVCGEWREIALTDSTLWSSLKIVVSLHESTPCPSTILLWLARSKSQPLSFAFELAPDVFPPLHENLQLLARPIFNLLSDNSWRWKHVNMSLPGRDISLKDLFTRSAPILETLALNVRSLCDEERSNINNFLQSAVSLRHFTFANRCSWGSWNDPYPSDVGALQVRWQNLSSLVIDTYITLQGAYEVLRQCHKIVNCDLRRLAGGAPIGDPSSILPLSLPHLKSLTIFQFELDEGLGALFDLLHCPGLLHFSVTCGFLRSTKWPQAQFSALLARSSCLLETLFLEFTGITADDLFQCLVHNSSSLFSLEIRDARGDICVTDETLDLLTDQRLPISHEALLCSKLETLILHRVVACSNGALANMLQSRREALATTCTKLRTVDVQFSKRDLDNDVDRTYLKTTQW